MTETDKNRINFCAKVFKAFGVAFTILANHKIVYQVGESWQCSTVEALERKAEQMLQYRQKSLIR
jgi:hypothetical protein